MKRYVIWAVLAAVLAGNNSVMAAVIAGNEWDTAADVEVWGISGSVNTPGDNIGPTIDGANGSIAQGSAYGPNALEITGALIGGAAVDFISADADATPEFGAGSYNGSYAAVQSIRLGFYDGEGLTATDDLRIYFYSNAGNTWFHDVDNHGGWGDYGANFVESDWYGGGTWATDIGNVLEVGIYISYLDGGGSQQYALGYFQLNDEPLEVAVPEPETYAMLGFAMVSLCVTFRRKLESSLQVVVQNLRA